MLVVGAPRRSKGGAFGSKEIGLQLLIWVDKVGYFFILSLVLWAWALACIEIFIGLSRGSILGFFPSCHFN